jgi:hypothetical protein
MCGILVATEAEDFARLDALAAHRIYEEVSLPSLKYEQLLSEVA